MPRRSITPKMIDDRYVAAMIDDCNHTAEPGVFSAVVVSHIDSPSTTDTTIVRSSRSRLTRRRVSPAGGVGGWTSSPGDGPRRSRVFVLARGTMKIGSVDELLLTRPGYY